MKCDLQAAEQKEKEVLKRIETKRKSNLRDAA